MTTYVNIHERKIRESRDFHNIGIFDYHQTQLSARVQKQQSGWINAGMFRKEEGRELNT
jgi:hypothetical protein